MDKMKKKLSPEEQDAKMSVLKDIMGNMDDLIAGDLDGKKKMKVSVISDSKQGLEKGLDKAEDLMKSKTGPGFPKFGAESEPGSMMNEEDYNEDSALEPEGYEEDEDECLSSSDIDAKIKKLMDLKERKSVKAPF